MRDNNINKFILDYITTMEIHKSDFDKTCLKSVNEAENKVSDHTIQNKGNEIHDEINAEKKNIKDTIDTILKHIQERQLLLRKSQTLQQKLAIYITGSSEKDYFQKLNLSDDADEWTFRDLIDTITDTAKELENISNQSSDEIDSLKQEIEEKEISLTELKLLFKETIEKTALHSVNSQTGERFSVEEVKEILMKEEEAFRSLQEYQLYSIQKKHNLELALKKKTNLAEGPLDFAEYEMMSIETQNNREIIQPISEEIKNITKRASKIINVLSHLEQKLYLAQKEKTKALCTEKLLEKELNEMRDELFAEKMKYAKMKQESKKLQHKFLLLQYPHLIEDYNAMQQENEEAHKELEKLKTTYEEEIKLIHH